MAFAPGVQEAPVRAAQFHKHKIERGARCLQPRRLVEHGAGAGERGDREAVPVGQHLVVSAGLGTALAQSEQARAGGGEGGFLLRRAARSDAAQHRAAFPVAFRGHVIGGLERGAASPKAASISSSPHT